MVRYVKIEHMKRYESRDSPEDQVGSGVSDKGDPAVGSLGERHELHVVLLRLRNLERRSFLRCREKNTNTDHSRDQLD
jgi:hypothetical protein